MYYFDFFDVIKNYLICVVNVVAINEVLHDQVNESERSNKRANNAVRCRQGKDKQHPENKDVIMFINSVFYWSRA